ncbi:hypothetical protein PHISP_04102 [Aspergillus sp. HF37]|nr:hypothetical protein PHISP_04102 [Aspergillus sp. HF37]
MAERPDIQDTLDRIQPLPGQVLPIKTVQETQPREEFGMCNCLLLEPDQLTDPSGDAYAAEVNIKSASKVIK